MKPALLLIGGMLNDERLWDRVAPCLRDAADVYLLAPDQDSIEDMARAAWERLAAAPSRVPIVVAGFSLGGYVLAAAATPACRGIFGGVGTTGN